MVADADTDEVLGVTMVGAHAGHEAAMAMRFRARLRDFIDLLNVFPSMAEALKMVATSRYKDPTKLSAARNKSPAAPSRSRRRLSATFVVALDILHRPYVGLFGTMVCELKRPASI